MRIYKYQLEVTDRQVVELPVGAEILSIQVQQNKPVLWALVNEKYASDVAPIRVYGTGHQLPDDIDAKDFLGTLQFHDETLAFHFFKPSTST